MTRSIPEYEPSQDTSNIKPFAQDTAYPIAPLKAEGRSTKELTQERGAVYGPPTEHFSSAQQLYEVWRDYRMSIVCDEWCVKEYALHHAMKLIFDKLTRLAFTPSHEDSWDDVGGYAKCGKETQV